MIFIDVLQGMLISLITAILVIVYRSSRPHLSVLGKVPEGEIAYSDVARHPENVTVPGLIILRLDAPLYYSNALTVRDQVIQKIKGAGQPLKAVLSDAAVQDGLDITSSDMLKNFIKRMNNQGIPVYFADMQDLVLEFGAKTGLLDLIGEDHVFATVDSAVRHIETNVNNG